MKRKREEMEVLSSSTVVTQSETQLPSKKEPESLYFPVASLGVQHPHNPSFSPQLAKSYFNIHEILQNLENPNVNLRLQAIELLLSSNSLLSREVTKLLQVDHQSRTNQLYEPTSHQSIIQNATLEHSHLFEILRRLLKVEVNNEIKILLIRSLSALSFSFFSESKDILLDFYSLLSSTNSKSVKQHIATSLEKMLRHKKIINKNETVFLQLEDLSFQLLKSTKLSHGNAHLRRSLLSLLSILCFSHFQPKLPHSLEGGRPQLDLIDPRSVQYSNQRRADFIHLVSDYAKSDPDPRVRKTAFDCLLSLHYQTSYTLDLDLYKITVEALNDDFEDVRLQAIELLWVLCNTHSTFLFSSENEENLLVDDGFIRISNMINDISTAVRSKACGLLGGLRNVSEKYLFQGFSKEILGKGGKMKLSRTKSNDMSAAGDFDLSMSGDVNVLDSGAGVFVHALEDEFYQVRLAAIDSICELSWQFSRFADMAVDFLVDMFSDEIDLVRINSINSLRKISANVKLKEEQLHIALSVLEDANEEIRRTMQHLLQAIRFCNIQCTHGTIQALLLNYKRYPQDLNNIFYALRGIGKNHATFVEYLIEDLLKIDHKFIAIEAKVSDVQYICSLIVICAAAEINPSILSLLPSFSHRHYCYLRDKYPDFFPESLRFPRDNNLYLSFPSTSIVTASSSHDSLTSDSSSLKIDVNDDDEKKHAVYWINKMDQFVAKIWTLLPSLVSSPPNFDVLHDYFTSFNRDIQMMSEIMEKDSIDYINCSYRSKLLLAFNECLSIAYRLKFTTHLETIETLVKQLITLTYQIQHQFLGLHLQTISILHQFRIFAYAHILLSPSQQPSTLNSNISGLERLVSRFISFASSFSLPIPPFFSLFCDQLRCLQPDSTSPASTSSSPSFPSNFSSFIADWEIPGPPTRAKMGNVKYLGAQFLRPTNNSDHVIVFDSRLPLPIQISAELSNFRSPNYFHGLLICCTLPDKTKQIFPIQSADIVAKGPMLHSVSTSIHIRSPPHMSKGWTENCFIELQFVKLFEPDFNFETPLISSFSFSLKPEININNNNNNNNNNNASVKKEINLGGSLNSSLNGSLSSSLSNSLNNLLSSSSSSLNSSNNSFKSNIYTAIPIGEPVSIKIQPKQPRKKLM